MESGYLEILYPIPNVHVIQTMCGMHVCMFSDKEYPMPEKLLKRLLWKKLEIPPNPVGNDQTNAEQLVERIKFQLRRSLQLRQSWKEVV